MEQFMVLDLSMFVCREKEKWKTIVEMMVKKTMENLFLPDRRIERISRECKLQRPLLILIQIGISANVVDTLYTSHPTVNSHLQLNNSYYN